MSHPKKVFCVQAPFRYARSYTHFTYIQCDAHTFMCVFVSQNHNADLSVALHALQTPRSVRIALPASTRLKVC